MVAITRFLPAALIKLAREIMTLLSFASIISVADLAAVADEPTKGQNAVAEEWKPLFDGKALAPWVALDKFYFDQPGEVSVKDGSLLLGTGTPATGVRWTGKFPKMGYELSLEAKRVEGSDFFCGLTFPIGDRSLTLILGGWGGWVTGLSCIDGNYAIDNETCQKVEFQQGRWYRIRVTVDEKVHVWLDDKQIIELATADRKLAVSEEMQPCLPLGIATWRTTGAVRAIRYRMLPAAEKSAERSPR